MIAYVTGAIGVAVGCVLTLGVQWYRNLPTEAERRAAEAARAYRREWMAGVDVSGLDLKGLDLDQPD